MDPLVATYRICDEILAHAGPLRVALATSAADRRAVFRLRCECLIQEGWARREEFPDGLEHDGHDEGAIHIVVWDEAALAGTIRLVPPAAGRRLPTEEAFGLALEPVGEVADGGRLVVARAHRAGRGHRVLALLFARLWLEAGTLGVRRIAAASPRPVVALWRRLGLEVELLGPPRRHWGEERFPVLISATASAFAGTRKA